MKRQILLAGIVCVCVALLLVTPCLAAQHGQKCHVKMDPIKGTCHVGDFFVISGKTKNIPDGYMLDLNFESAQKSVVPLSAPVVNNRYTATIDSRYLGEGRWSVWASAPWVGFPPWNLPNPAISQTRSFTVLP
ncbi:hypothetical protein SZ63_07555 [Methanoculleus sediminis]|uniref:Uncharacterized protein n=1 Tax=Methanoculleus sediminis TaxID=1550566 RepID=A0A0H1QZ58_9EURY|nr:hypothetical protein [Methanoculleus sediminis]KLK87876.1 hypothetical protein SZ63_07555 [Methanoculleus sediminis]